MPASPKPALDLATAESIATESLDQSDGTALRAESPRRSPAFYRPELDILRFCAFLLVFLHHALPHSTAEYSFIAFRPAQQLLAAIARGGALGVDLFFALSAYLITELLLRESYERGRIDLRSFYIRRILRIWPLYFFALLTLAPLLTLLDPGDQMPWSYVAGYSLLSGNWVTAAWGYPVSSFALLWTVSIEEQFYLLWPWVVSSMPALSKQAEPATASFGLGSVTTEPVQSRDHRERSVPRKALLRWIVGMVALAWVTRIGLALAGVTHPGVWTNTFARLDPIAGGAALAVLLKGGLPRASTWVRIGVIGIGAVVLIGLSAAGWHDGWESVVSYPLTAVACVGILYAMLGWSGGLTGSWLGSCLGYLGKISYGLYVLHVAAIRILEKGLAGSKLVMPAALLLTIGLAALSYRFLESPFLRLKEKFARVSSRPV
ncbi:MAG: acyltransferase [Acidobacteriota bacterium]